MSFHLNTGSVGRLAAELRAGKTFPRYWRIGIGVGGDAGEYVVEVSDDPAGPWVKGKPLEVSHFDAGVELCRVFLGYVPA